MTFLQNSWGGKRHPQARKGQYQLNCILFQLYWNMHSFQARLKISQWHWMRQLEWQCDTPQAKKDLPLINFRSRERHQHDLVPLSYHRQRLQRKGKGGWRGDEERDKKEGMWLVRMKSLVSDNNVNLAVKKILTSNKWNSPCQFRGSLSL